MACWQTWEHQLLCNSTCCRVQLQLQGAPTVNLCLLQMHQKISQKDTEGSGLVLLTIRTAWLLQGCAGILEMSIQTDIPAELSGGSKQAAVVTTMAVMPRLQRQGIGSALLDAAEGWAACHRVEVVALFVYRDNDAAIRCGLKNISIHLLQNPKQGSSSVTLLSCSS